MLLNRWELALGMLEVGPWTRFSVQHFAFSLQRFAFSVQHLAFSLQRSAFSV